MLDATSKPRRVELRRPLALTAPVVLVHRIGPWWGLAADLAADLAAALGLLPGVRHGLRGEFARLAIEDGPVERPA